MKTLITVLSCLGLPFPASAQENAPPSSPAPATAPRAECSLCKVPNRAALFAGTARQCPAECPGLCCTGTEVTYLVEGLVCLNCSSAVSAALAKLDGVYVDAVCHHTGQARLRYDPAIVPPATLRATIAAAGHPVTGEKLTLHIPELADESRAAAAEAALTLHPGVLKVVTTGGASPTLVLVFDPARTSGPGLLASLRENGFALPR